MGRYKSYLMGVQNEGGGGSRPLLDNVQKKDAFFMASLSVGSEQFPQAPILPHPSRGGGSNCPTRRSQLSDKVVLIVRQNLAIGTTLSGK